MANVAHASLTGANLHEPKGVAAAAVDKVYVSDGAGSGAWQKIETDQLDSTGQNIGRIIVADGANGTSWTQAVWKDLIGDISPKTSGATAPTFGAYRGNVWQYSFDSGDESHFTFHVPHDYKPGSDMYIHVHWSHTDAVSITGNIQFTFDVTYAKGHNQANFAAPIALTTSTYATTNLATTPQYRHRIEEVQLSAASPTASQLDSDDLEVDGIIMVRTMCPTQPTFGGTGKVFIHTVDIHYQAAYIGTKNKVPDFYV